jgi:hypothetical protein
MNILRQITTFRLPQPALYQVQAAPLILGEDELNQRVLILETVIQVPYRYTSAFGNRVHADLLE